VRPVTVFAAAAATVASAVVLLANAPASANTRVCPPKTDHVTVPVTGQRVDLCVEFLGCDPGPCASTAPPQE